MRCWYLRLLLGLGVVYLRLGWGLGCMLFWDGILVWNLVVCFFSLGIKEESKVFSGIFVFRFFGDF